MSHRHSQDREASSKLTVLAPTLQRQIIDFYTAMLVAVAAAYAAMLLVYGATGYTKRVSSRNNCIWHWACCWPSTW